MSFHRNHWLLFGTIFFGFIAIAIAIAIAPAYWVQVQTRANQDVEPLSEEEKRGLGVYVSEGCVACHTQQVRPIEMDSPWGRPSARRDYANLGGTTKWWRPYAPAVLGSARIGPDLSNIGNRQSSEAWQYLHLYNPRAVVGDSIMPAYPWLFEVTDNPDEDATVVSVPEPYGPDEGKVVSTPRGEALVSYLLSLKQPREGSAGGSADAPEQGGETAREDSSDETDGGADDLPDGKPLYSQHCASCHQDSGQGVPGTFPGLVGNGTVTADDPGKHIRTVLDGAQGRTIDGQTYPSPMPGFADQLSNDEIAAIVNHERTSWGNDAPTVTGDDVARIRNEGGE